MSRYRILCLVAAALSATHWAYACGDGATEALPPPPDPPRPATVTVTPATAQLGALDATVQLTAEVRDQNGRAMAGAAVTWASGSAAVATVSGSGLVTAAGNGTATITAVAGDARGTAEITVENPDRAALVALYEATDGRNWRTRDTWLTDAPLSDWHGVETDGVGRVTRLVLRENGLAGELPAELGDLTALERLELARNGLTGPIPRELGALSNLRWLLLEGNNLEGPIPVELSNLSKLESLELAGNHLTGPIPSALGRLSSLERLWLANNFLEGPIPEELGNLSNLKRLWLKDTGLTGPVPPELGNLAELERLELANNALTGPIPPEFGKLSRLGALELTRNQLTGPLPASVLGLTDLSYVTFGENAGLCMPGTAAFVEWAEGMYYDVEGPFCNEADRTALDALYEAAGGAEWSDAEGWRGERAVGDWHGVTADALGRVVEIDLESNGLEGSVPGELGDLTHMTVLKLSGNALSGRLPRSLARLPLQEFRYGGTELCAPPSATFQEWLNGIAVHQGTGMECAPFSDREALVALYEATDGPNWTNRDSWLTGAPLADWHGVDVDAEGRVTVLWLPENGLSGCLPTQLGDLHRLAHLDLRDNDLEGSIPPDIGSLAVLDYLNLSRNRLTGSIPPELGNLSRLEGLRLSPNLLTGAIPPELGNLSALRHLWIADNELTGPIPPELGGLSNLEAMWLRGNSLTGAIPPELGSLSNLEYLHLGDNYLTGAIPPELGNLTRLEYLNLGRPLGGWNRKGLNIREGGGKSQTLSGSIPPEFGGLTRLQELHVGSQSLSGPIPPELGNLSNLEELYADDNFLSGPIPAELGNLARLRHLSLTRNQLTGSVPPALGNLARLIRLGLDYNALSGALPPDLGGLAAVERMELSFNRLEGPLPATFGGLANLEALRLSDNAAMSGALPDSLTALERLEDLAAGGTELCAPADSGFTRWLERIPDRRIARCGHAVAAAYLVQAVQSRELPVPLVAGDDALLRVFPTAAVATDAGIPAVRTRFYIDGREAHVEDIPGKAGPLPTEVDEGSLETSANAVIPGTVIQPGLEMVVEIDPDGTLDPSLGVARRVPETGRLAFEVAAMPHDLTLVPFLRIDDPDSLVLSLTERMAAGPHNDEALWRMKTLLPVADDFQLTLHEPVWTSDNSNYGPVREAQALQVLEGATGHYIAMLSADGTSTGLWETRTTLIYADDAYRTEGDGWLDRRLAGLIAHEMGHAMTLGHTTGCKPGQRDYYLDPSYPYPTGIIGAWGWDPGSGGMLVGPRHWEVMSACNWISGWISDYNFTKMFRHRLRYDFEVAATASLLLWGGVDEAGAPFLKPAFVVDAPPALPDSTGPYTVTGTADDGRELFSFDFPIYEAPDGEGNGSFVFALPVRPGWEGNLASITLTGPGGSFTLDGATDRPMTILRDPSTGQVRAFLRDPVAMSAAADGIGRGGGFETLFSRGIPDVAAWRRR